MSDVAPPAASPPTEGSAIEQATIEERRVQVGELEIFYRYAEPQTTAPVLYVHGVPTHSGEWTTFLARTGGIALDLPGFGRSSKPASDEFSYSIAGYDEFMRAFIDAVGIDRFSLVVHDWGAHALHTAAALHDKVESLVIVNAVPLLPGYRWHRTARIWRTPIAGELFMGFSTKTATKWALRESNATPGSMPPEFIEMWWSQFDYGTQRAILKLYRSAPPNVLAAAGERLRDLDAPALVLWGESDPYIPWRFGEAYAQVLPNAEFERIAGAGHWPWIDRPDTVDRITGFLRTGHTAG